MAIITSFAFNVIQSSRRHFPINFAHVNYSDMIISYMYSCTTTIYKQMTCTMIIFTSNVQAMAIMCVSAFV